MNWRERLDARIDRCPSCDEWRWDRQCHSCAKPVEFPVDRDDLVRILEVA